MSAKPRDAATHAHFLGKLDASRYAVWVVAMWLNGLGKAVLIPAERKAEKHEDWASHVDGGDLFVMPEDRMVASERIEVRHIGTRFRSEEDWKHKPHFMVATVESFDRCTPRPDVWITVSHDYKAVAVVKVDESRDKWYVAERKHGDHATEPGKQCDHYFCPLEFVTWWWLG